MCCHSFYRYLPKQVAMVFAESESPADLGGAYWDAISGGISQRAAEAA